MKVRASIKPGVKMQDSKATAWSEISALIPNISSVRVRRVSLRRIMARIAGVDIPKNKQIVCIAVYSWHRPDLQRENMRRPESIRPQRRMT